MANPPRRRVTSVLPMLLALAIGRVSPAWGAESEETNTEGTIAKRLIRVGESNARANLLKEDGWQAVDRGFERQGDQFFFANPTDADARGGALQRVVLDQEKPQPIVASASSRAESVSGSNDEGYSLYLDIVFMDGSELWGQHAPFSAGTHGWQGRNVLVFPDRPIRHVNVYLLFRGHAGKAWFREPTLSTIEPTGREAIFDGLAVVPEGTSPEGFQVRDVATDDGFVRISKEAIGLRLDVKREERESSAFFDVTLRDTSGKDRVLTLLYSIPVPPEGVTWFDDPRRSTAVEPGREYVHASSFQGVGNGRLSSYPLAALAHGGKPSGMALGIDMARPAFYRIGYNAGTAEFWVAFDVGLAPEKPEARLRFCRFDFDPAWGFRSALARYYQLFPEAFRRRITDQGLWMPFAKISRIKNWEDFHFRFKEGNDEAAWDDEHGILTFRYTEPLTWWMPMPNAMPRTLGEATNEAKRLAEQGKAEAKALFSSGYHGRDSEPVALFRDEPWNRGAVWSMNSMPGIAGEFTDFKTKWNPKVRERLYGPTRRGELDGEYVDSSEGYVTAELDFRRDHFAAADTPLVFSMDDHRPAIFRGLIAFEYVRAIAEDVHGMNKLMMANATPDRLCWLAPMLDVMGTETDWNPRGKWRPMPDADMLYRRVLCKGKPFCFLMNTDFERLSPELVEKYMKRAIAYGFFPGFFSHNAAEGHYFTRPELFDRDRPLFKKLLPLCKLIAEAGWEPLTLARSSNSRIHVERFGDAGTQYITIFNDSSERQETTIRFESRPPVAIRELLSDPSVNPSDGRFPASLNGEDLQVLELKY